MARMIPLAELVARAEAAQVKATEIRRQAEGNYLATPNPTTSKAARKANELELAAVCAAIDARNALRASLAV